MRFKNWGSLFSRYVAGKIVMSYSRSELKLPKSRVHFHFYIEKCEGQASSFYLAPGGLHGV